MKTTPSVIAKNFDEVRTKIALVDGLVEWAELDVMDGVFVPNVTWQIADDLRLLEGKTKLSAHLMIEAPETVVEDWQSGADRLIVHLEATDDMDGLIERQSVHCPLGVALNLATPVAQIFPYLDRVKLVQLMSIARTGFGGELFDETVFDKIKILKKGYPDVKIIVDGGISLEIAQKLLTAGADELVVGSAIWNAPDPVAALRQFQTLSQ
ncbi:MAG: ribulose-phosphate 3-epimerase [Candidatus Vogelbacteria bacterium CG10_big_fil_rev_8_21_14_0_10_49_38]|uniref:Ribulose-phosphate 3-epimerase n=1 Tax=Candidatus Vogelbacteria bacterium CG10_big_fil_rev_8_21_14_0_10_49_38 TaxID=1975043 RepID=A0A2H0RI33_9BACT|nr:MAG: hypothetical protein BK006_01575 [bacterium CG10_49_38]PIR46086.1 MAG: ribulose-phosphate 3-epimerase [Candidatus Vogelbacteria bacterium CG10_big_fil_rev_8_21_14_0_10_49_38]